MTKYHFNPETGDPGVCKAEVACPFGIPLNSHATSLREAAQAGEAHMLEVNGGSFSAPKQAVIPTFEEWMAAKEEKERNPGGTTFVEPVASVEAYRMAMPTGLESLGDMAREVGLDLVETGELASRLKAGADPRAVRRHIANVVQDRVEEARKNVNHIADQLDKSFYFGDRRVRIVGDRSVTESYGHHGDLDLITRVDDKGKASFEIFDRATGENQRLRSPEDIGAEGGHWGEHFKLYQDHLYTHAAWCQEHRRRNDRSAVIVKRLVS